MNSLYGAVSHRCHHSHSFELLQCMSVASEWNRILPINYYHNLSMHTFQPRMLTPNNPAFLSYSACLCCNRVQNRALSAIAQAESLRFKLVGGLAVRRACYGVMRYVMDNGAKVIEIVISVKLRAARAKAMIFRDGYMIKSGD